MTNSTADPSAFALPRRHGHRPSVRRELPHSQLDQQPDDDVRAHLEQRFRGIDGVTRRPSGISVPGAEALCVPDGAAMGPAEAFIVDREFAHLHPVPDSSLHIALPEPSASLAIEAGWAELHPLSGTPGLPATTVLVYAPRDESELDVVMRLVEQSHRHASASAGNRHV